MISIDLHYLRPVGSPRHQCQFSQGQAKCLSEGLERRGGGTTVHGWRSNCHHQGVDVIAAADLGSTGAGFDPD